MLACSTGFIGRGLEVIAGLQATTGEELPISKPFKFVSNYFVNAYFSESKTGSLI